VKSRYFLKSTVSILTFDILEFDKNVLPKPLACLPSDSFTGKENK
jgi:hypothetical protein